MNIFLLILGLLCFGLIVLGKLLGPLVNVGLLTMGVFLIVYSFNISGDGS